MLNEKEINRFWDLGYLHLKNIFNEKEINSYRDYILQNLSDENNIKEIKSDLLSDKFFNDLLLDDRILGIVNSLLGSTPVYFGDSNWTILNNDATGTYHSDNVDRYRNGPDWEDKKYPIIRYGLYLQDHKNNGGGIILGGKSHKKFIKNKYIRNIYQEIIALFNGNFKYMDSQIGDLIIWNLKTTHSANGQFFKFFKKPISYKISKFIPNFLKSKSTKNRIMISATFAKEGISLNRYIDHLKKRKYSVENYLNQNIDEMTINKLNSKNVKYLNIHEEVKKDIKNKKIKFQDLDNYEKLYGD